MKPRPDPSNRSMDLTLAIADRVVDNRAGVQGKERSLTLTGADIGVRLMAPPTHM
jgi:hypothetical protein